MGPEVGKCRANEKYEGLWEVPLYQAQRGEEAMGVGSECLAWPAAGQGWGLQAGSVGCARALGGCRAACLEACRRPAPPCPHSTRRLRLC